MITDKEWNKLKEYFKDLSKPAPCIDTTFTRSHADYALREMKKIEDASYINDLLKAGY